VADPGERRTAVFAYGSLVNPASASQTLGRPAGPVEPVRLTGWRRRFSLARDNLASEKTFALASDASLPPIVLSLNIEPEPGSAGPNGVLIDVTDAELSRLDLREIRYDRIDVTAAVREADGRFEAVYAYTAKLPNTAIEPPPGAVVLAAYVDAVEAAFASLGGEQRLLYLETTGPPPVAVVEAVLVEDRIPEGNPRAW
jgi:cation transport regulator ChaC